MPDRNVERNLTGETVEEKDRARLQLVRSGLADLRQEIHGLPSEQIVVEGESIEPVPLTPGLDPDPDSLHQSRSISLTLNASHSSFAKKIREDRLRKKGVKKAA